LVHAGPLWRDEINSLYVANTQSVHDFTAALVFNPFPALFAAVLRIWIALGFDNWDKQIACLLRSHAVETERVALNEKQSIDPREHEEVFAFSGWRA